MCAQFSRFRYTLVTYYVAHLYHFLEVYRLILKNSERISLFFCTAGTREISISYSKTEYIFRTFLRRTFRRFDVHKYRIIKKYVFRVIYFSEIIQRNCIRYYNCDIKHR